MCIRKNIVSIAFGVICDFRHPLGSWSERIPSEKGDYCAPMVSQDALLLVGRKMIGQAPGALGSRPGLPLVGCRPWENLHLSFLTYKGRVGKGVLR